MTMAMAMAQQYCKKTAVRKCSWSPEEDQKLRACIKKYGIWNWSEIPKAAGLFRTGKSCRLRWVNYLRPDIKRGNFSEEEEEAIFKLHQQLGNRWSTIAARLPGRTDNEIKNYWHTHLKKRLGKNPVSTAKSQAMKSSSAPKAPETGGSSTDIPVSPKLFAQIDDPVIGTDTKEPISETIVSSETFAKLENVRADSVPPEDLHLAADYQTTFSDPGFTVPIFQSSFQEPTYPYGSYDDAEDEVWLKLLIEADMAGI